MHVCMQYISSELNAARVATTGRLWENLPPNSVPLIVIMTLNCRSMELAALGARAKSQFKCEDVPDDKYYRNTGRDDRSPTSGIGSMHTYP